MATTRIAKRKATKPATAGPQLSREIAPATVPNTDVLPGYVLERNAQALSAGLAIERQVIKNGRLTTWYRGTEQQWRRSIFYRRKGGRKGDRPFCKTVTQRDFACFSLHGCAGSISLWRKSDDNYRGVIANEQLPNWTDDLGDGISVYEMKVRIYEKKLHEGVELVYVGPMQALIDREIAPAEIADESWKRAGTLFGGPIIWTCDTAPDGQCIFRDQITVREHLAREEADSHKTNFKHPSELIKHWTAMAAVELAVMTKQYKRTETNDGRIFAVTKDSLETIEALTDELLDAIRCAQVTARDANPLTVEQRQQVGRANSDRSFQRFMTALSPDAGTGTTGAK